MEGIIIVRNIPATDYDDDNNDVDKVVKGEERVLVHILLFSPWSIKHSSLWTRDFVHASINYECPLKQTPQKYAHIQTTFMKL